MFLLSLRNEMFIGVHLHRGRTCLSSTAWGWVGDFVLGFNVMKAVCVPAKLLQSCPILCDPVHCSPPGPSVHGILQASIKERVAMPSSRGSSSPRTEPASPALTGCFFNASATWEALKEGCQSSAVGHLAR